MNTVGALAIAFSKLRSCGVAFVSHSEDDIGSLDNRIPLKAANAWERHSRMPPSRSAIRRVRLLATSAFSVSKDVTQLANIIELSLIACAANSFDDF